jgi:hypothetical protein
MKNDSSQLRMENTENDFYIITRYYHFSKELDFSITCDGI